MHKNMNVSRNRSRFGLCLAAICLLLTAGCSGSLPGAALLTPPALRTEIAAQTAAAESQPQPDLETAWPTMPPVEATAEPSTTPGDLPRFHTHSAVSAAHAGTVPSRLRLWSAQYPAAGPAR